MENVYNEFNTWVDSSSILPIKNIKDGDIKVSPEGMVLDSRGAHKPSYLSTNGLIYEFIHTTDSRYILYPFDIIMASAFVQPSRDLINKDIRVHHKNGRTSDCYYTNLEWIEDVEEWKPIEYKDIKKGCYEISNRGRVRAIMYDPPIIMKVDNSSGYSRLNLLTDGMDDCVKKAKHYSIHRLVAWHFVMGYTQERNYVNHIDCDRTNNHWNNLEWVSLKENNRHALDCGLIPKGSENGMAKITEHDAVEICYSLNRNDGCIIDTFNEMKESIPTLTYPIVSMIKYGETFTYVSNTILTEDGRKKQIRQTDPDVILDTARCLKKYNGDVKKTKKELELIYPWISYGWLWHIKDKSVAADITDLVFKKDEFPKGKPLTESDALKIIHSLLSHKGDPYVNQTVFNELKDEIDGLSKDKVRAIKEKKAWKTLSDKYFNKGDI